MANGLPRTTKYQDLNAERHLFYLDNDLDTMDVKMEERDNQVAKALGKMDSTLTRILWAFIGLLITVLGALIAVVVTSGGK